MITTDNYFQTIAKLKVDKLPQTLKASHDFVKDATGNGSSWKVYSSDEEIKEMIDLYFKQLDNHLKATSNQKTEKKASVSKKTTSPKKEATQKRKASSRPTVNKKATSRPVKSKPPRKTPKPVEAFSEEISIIKRMLNMHGKEKTLHQVRLALNWVQKKILQKWVRKSSPYAAEINYIQKSLVLLYERMLEKKLDVVKPELSEKYLDKFQQITGSVAIRPSVRFIQSYINLHGKLVEPVRVTNLHNRIATAINKKKITKADPYYEYLEKIIASLRSFNCEVPKSELKIHHQTLSGLNGVLGGLSCQKTPNLSGIDNSKRIRISSDQLAQLQFDSIGFTGKWLDFIGDPEPGFSTLIFGKPKFGKSYLSVEWAGYLSKNHGKVAYIAKEEGISTTIKDKLLHTSAGNPNLEIFNYMPDDHELAEFDFVFLDSVQRLGISPEQENELKDRHPSISFIAISQTTKNGIFRGSNTREHDVDVVIEVPERGKAIQYGRFNQGGEMEIF